MIYIICAILLLLGSYLIARFSATCEILCNFNICFGYFTSGLMAFAAVLFVFKAFHFI